MRKRIEMKLLPLVTAVRKQNHFTLQAHRARSLGCHSRSFCSLPSEELQKRGVYAQGLHRLRLPAHSCPISSSISWYFRIFCRTILPIFFGWKKVCSMSLPRCDASVLIMSTVGLFLGFPFHYCEKEVIWGQLTIVTISLIQKTIIKHCQGTARQWPADESKSSHPSGTSPAKSFRGCSWYSREPESPWHPSNTIHHISENPAPAAEAARFQMLAIALVPQT